MTKKQVKKCRYRGMMQHWGGIQGANSREI